MPEPQTLLTGLAIGESPRWHAEWLGPEHMTDGRRTGQALTAPAPAPGVGWP